MLAAARRREAPAIGFGGLNPAKLAVAGHPLIAEFASGSLSVAERKHAVRMLYPLQRELPRYAHRLAVKLGARSDVRTELQRWLVAKVRLERNRLRWHHRWALRLGVSPEELGRDDSAVSPLIEYVHGLDASGSP